MLNSSKEEVSVVLIHNDIEDDTKGCCNKICHKNTKLRCCITISILVIMLLLVITTIVILKQKNDLLSLIWFMMATIISICLTSCVFTKENVNKLKKWLE